MKKQIIALVATTLMGIGIADAQLNQNSCKFLGNITTRGQVQPNVGNLKYENLWDQMTPENETKWGSIANKEVQTVEDALSSWNWRSADSEYQWCKENGVQFKFHCLLWTSQYPSYLANFTGDRLKKQIDIWFEAVSKKYPDLTVMDVVNEAIIGHAENDNNGQAKTFKNNLANAMSPGSQPRDYKWITEAFKLARKYFPNTILIYNDYNTLTHQKNDFIDLVSTLVKQGAPIDAYGHQTHDLDDYYNARGNMSGFEDNLRDIHNQITQKGGRELQCYITEYDINQSNDNTQLTIMQGSFPAMWEADFVAGITIWGFVNGATWRANTGLVNGQGQDRSSMKWLREYMASDKAKNVTAKFCGKEAGGPAGPYASIEASKTTIVLGNSVDLSVKVNNVEGGVRSITYYDGNNTIGEGEKITWTPESAGSHSISVVVITNSNEEVKGTSTIKVVEPGKPYGGTAATIPGKIEAENYDEGESGIAFFDQSAGNSCDDQTNEYRKDDVDIKTIDGGYAVGSFQDDEWMAYTVDVQEDGEYNVSIRLGEGNDSGSLSVSLDKSDVSFDVKVSKLGDWGTFEEVKLDPVTLKKGEQVMTIKNTGSWIDVDWINFEKVGGETGFEENINTPIAIGPNPATSVVKVFGVTPISVEFVSAEGVVVKKCSGNVISVADLQDGNYIVRIVTENGTTVKKLVVGK